MPKAPDTKLTKPTPLLSIRVLTSTACTCASCDEPTGTGPAGHQDDDPLCDLCMLESSPQLGMVLALVNITRAFGGIPLASVDESHAALVELGTFARIYEQFARRHSPPHSFRLPEADRS